MLRLIHLLYVKLHAKKRIQQKTSTLDAVEILNCNTYQLGCCAALCILAINFFLRIPEIHYQLELPRRLLCITTSSRNIGLYNQSAPVLG